jgi:hypothetical protein
MFFALLKGEAVGFVVSSDHGRNRGILPHVHGRALCCPHGTSFLGNRVALEWVCCPRPRRMPQANEDEQPEATKTAKWKGQSWLGRKRDKITGQWERNSTCHVPRAK